MPRDRTGHTAAATVEEQPRSEAWGPTVRGRGRRLRPGRRLLLAITLVLVLALVGAATGGVWASSRIPRQPVTDLAPSGRPLHVLVVGSDTREGLTPEQRRELSTGSAEGERTDTIFLLTVQGREAAVLAFPRDLWVRRCDGTTGRINAAQSIGGPGCLVRTIRDLSGIDIQHHVEVTFGGFVDLVDVVGGVELCLEEAIADRDAGIDLPAGCQRLDGPDALGYVRVRKIDDDLHRIERQQRFLRALADEILTPRTLLDPRRSVPLVTQAGGAVTLDDRAGVLALGRMGLGATALARGTAVSHTVPAEPFRTSGGAAVLRMREAEAEALFARYRDGSILVEAPDDAEAAPPAPGDVEVVVQNGAGVSGLAGRVGARLEAEGFVVAGIGNADRRDRSLVVHPPGQRAAAELVARTLGIAPGFEEAADVTSVTLVLGRDAGGLA